MYSDIQNTAAINNVEIELAKLAQAASKVVNEFLNLSKDKFTIITFELDSLKKFLCILSFRHPQQRSTGGYILGYGTSWDFNFDCTQPHTKISALTSQ